MAPGQAMAAELGWPAPLHLVTVGIGGALQGAPSPRGCQGCPHALGSSSKGGRRVVRAGVDRAELGMGLESTQFSSWSLSSLFSTCFPYLDLLFLSSPPLLAILILLLLLLSSSLSSLLLGCLLLFSSWPSHPFPSSSSPLDLPLFSSWPHHHLLGHFLLSPLQPLLSTPEMTWGHAVCHHKPRFRAGGVTVPSPAPSSC